MVRYRLNIDSLNRKVYYLSPDRKAIMMEPTYLKMGEVVEGKPSTLVRLPSAKIRSVVVDPETDTVFWTDTGDKIERMNNIDREVLFRGLDKPSMLSYDRATRLVTSISCSWLCI
jgi:hypothetical protein